MLKFEYTITDPVGIHARPASLIVKYARQFQSALTLTCQGKHADMTRLLSLMSLGIKKGDVVVIEADGEDEKNAILVLSQFFQENL